MSAIYMWIAEPLCCAPGTQSMVDVKHSDGGLKAPLGNLAGAVG